VSMLNKDFQYGIDMVMSVTYSSPFTNSSIIILLYFKYTHTVSIGLLLFWRISWWLYWTSLFNGRDLCYRPLSGV